MEHADRFPSGHGRLTRTVATVVAVAAIVLILPVGWFFSGSTAATAWDLAVLRFVESVQVPVLRGMSLGLSWLFSPLVGFSLVALATAWVAVVHRSVIPAAKFAACVLLPWWGGSLVRVLVQRPRPDQSALPHHLLTAQGSVIRAATQFSLLRSV